MVGKFVIIIIVAVIMIGGWVLANGMMGGASTGGGTGNKAPPSSSQTGNVRAFTPHGFLQTDCRCVAFRLDDVQDYWETSAQQQVMYSFASQHVPLTIGVIGNYLKDDRKHIEFIKSYINLTQLEVANHGWNHEDFTKSSLSQQTKLMNESNQAIKTTLGVEPTVFIAPYDLTNNNTGFAAKAVGIDYTSSSVDNAPFPYISPQTPSGVMEVPGTVDAGTLNETTNKWSPFTGPQIMHEIDKSVSKYGFAVVVLHPQVFFDTVTKKPDDAMLGQLNRLITLAQANYTTVKLSEIKNH